MSRWYKEGDALISQIRSTRLPEDMLAIWFMGQAGIVLKSGELTIAVDLYLENRPGRAVLPPFESQSCAWLFDYVFCSHNHADHLDSVLISGIAQAEGNCPKTRFVVPAPWKDTVASMGADASMVTGACHQEKIQLGEHACVIPVRAAHESFSTDGNGNYECLGFVFDFPGGCVYHSGDTVEWETMTDELRAYPVDIACLPINGSDWKRKKADIIGNLNAREAADVSAAIGADLLIPLHYDVFPHNGENPAYLADYLWRSCPERKYHIMAPGERFIYVKDKD